MYFSEKIYLIQQHLIINSIGLVQLCWQFNEFVKICCVGNHDGHKIKQCQYVTNHELLQDTVHLVE